MTGIDGAITGPSSVAALARAARGGWGRKANTNRNASAVLTDLLARRARANGRIITLLLEPMLRVRKVFQHRESTTAGFARRAGKKAGRRGAGPHFGESFRNVGRRATLRPRRRPRESEYRLNGKARRNSMTAAPPLSRFFTPTTHRARPRESQTSQVILCWSSHSCSALSQRVLGCVRLSRSSPSRSVALTLGKMRLVSLSRYT